MAVQANRNYVLTGHVTDPQGESLSGLIVRAFDQEVKMPENALGKEAVTEADGRYEIRFAADDFAGDGRESGGPDVFIRVFDADKLLGQSKITRNAPREIVLDLIVRIAQDDQNETPRRVHGIVRDAGGDPVPNVTISVFDRDLRAEQPLGRTQSNADGYYEITYTARQFRKAEKGSADIVARAYGDDRAPLAETPVLFNAPPDAQCDLILPADKRAPRSLFERIDQVIAPLLEGVHAAELEEGEGHRDLSFLAGETSFDIAVLARFALAHRLIEDNLPAEFWFALLGGSFFTYDTTQSLAAQTEILRDAAIRFDERAVRRGVERGFRQNEIAAGLREKAADWVAAFVRFAARRAVTGAGNDQTTFIKFALEDAGIRENARQEAFARVANQFPSQSPELFAALENAGQFTQAEIADVKTSAHLQGLTQGDFRVVKLLKDEFNIRQPEQIRSLAKMDAEQWVAFVQNKRDALDPPAPPADIAPPTGEGTQGILNQTSVTGAEAYGRTLERRFREAFPTSAFSGGLERASQNGGAAGLTHADQFRRFLGEHSDFELLTTPVDDYLNNNARPAFGEDDGFRQELKATQRVFKLAPNFEATHALLTDNIHSAQQIYRMGESGFARRYGNAPGFDDASARVAWNRAADTHAATLTIVADLASLRQESLPRALSAQPDAPPMRAGGAALRPLSHTAAALASFPNWNNLFQGGDLCDCEQCRSVLSAAAYFADLLLFLKDRSAANPADSVKDILLRRRPDLGYLELNCENALTLLRYIDVVNEVLEAAIAGDAADVELVGLTAIPDNLPATQALVSAALAAHQLPLSAEFSLTQTSAPALDRWAAHGDNAVYLLKKKATPNFFSEILRNTKASAEELAAYPPYVNAKAYDALKSAKYPLTLPFDLFAEETRAAMKKAGLARWELMRVFQGVAAPNNPTDGDIAAEYFDISADAAAPFDEKQLILTADTTVAGQKIVWGETGAAWIDAVATVKNFLNKTHLEYEPLLALLDLKFLNPAGDLFIHHLDASCDLDQKKIEPLDAAKLDRFHRFLRLWRKLPGWQSWELDLFLRHPRLGNGVINEATLIQLFYFCRLKDRLGPKTTVEQVCALFGDLNSDSHFTAAYEKRQDALYQRLFANRRLTQPLDAAFAIAPGATDVTPGQTLSAHHPVILAALGVPEASLLVFQGLTRPSTDLPYIADDLSRANLSFLWRHAFLGRALKFKAAEWAIFLKLLPQDFPDFTDPRTTLELMDTADQIKASGLTLDEINYLLTADDTAKSALREADAARFLSALRKQLQAIRIENDPAQYPFLTAPSDVNSLTTLLTSLLQKLGRDDAATQNFLALLSDTASLSAPVAGLPAGFDFPQAIKDATGIRYDQPNDLLRFTGLMSAAERTTLLNDPSLAAVTGIASYQDAIAALFGDARLALKFFDPTFIAPLAALPAAVDLTSLPDPALIRRVVYDAEQRALRVTGVLTAADKAALDALSADAAYRNAVNTLYTQPTIGVFPADALWLQDADLTLPLADNLPVNLAAAIMQALIYLSKTQAQEAVIQAASAQLGLTSAVTHLLLTQYNTPAVPLLTHLTGVFAATQGVIDRATLPVTFNAWTGAVRVAGFWNRAKLTLTEIQQIIALTAGAQLLDFGSLPLTAAGPKASLERFLRTARLLALRLRLPETNITLLETMTRLNGAGYTAANFAADLENLNEDWRAADAQILISSLNLAFPADYRLAENWERLVRAFAFLDKLNAGAEIVKTFAAPAMTATHAKTLQELLRSKFGAEDWLPLCGEIQDALRERKRDALTAYLLTQPKPADAPTGKWENSNDLYAYYLLDTEMTSCQSTSRLVQATGSVQLFVQRCFMGLEPAVIVQADGADGDSAWLWWEWMRKYRVWEANRKIFLWPENWIEPELKKDRSSFMKDMEQELLQNEINPDTVETAFFNYLEKLDGVAQLEVAGFYQEDDGDKAIIHTFGRTTGTTPHTYYYRRYDYRQWTPWEKVDLDIQGDYLIPAVVNSRLFLFWPVFTEVPDEAGNNSVSTPAPHETGVPLQKAKKSLRLQMAVSDFRRGKWTAKRVSNDFDQSGVYDNDIVRSHYRFYPIDRGEIDGRFGIKYDGYSEDANNQTQASFSGAFEIANCQGLPALSSLPGSFYPVVRPETPSVGNATSFLKWAEQSNRSDAPDDDFTLETIFSGATSAPRFTPVLNRTPWLFKMTPAYHLSYMDKLFLDLPMLSLYKTFGERQYGPAGSWLPFFYNDPKRTFFVLPCVTVDAGRQPSIAGAGSVREYYPDIKKSFRQWETWIEGQVQTFLDSLDLSLLTPAERLFWGNFYHAQFPDAPAPPYDDAQLRVLGKRFLMRIFHFYLGIASLNLYQNSKFHYKNFYHPFVCDFIRMVLNPNQGIPAVMKRETQFKNSGFSFNADYLPTTAVVQSGTMDFYPQEIVDFAPDGGYAPYNWELFFHAPLFIANSLSKNQRFEEARDWYHYIFNPIGVESAIPGGSPMSKFWITKPFYETTDPQYIQQRIDNISRLLAGDATAPGYSAQAKKDLEDQVRDWRDNPFEPHRIANYRTTAYQKTVVMKYLDNLVAWGDNLFSQDSMESINEATQLYILAAEILGPRPRHVPPQARPTVESFNELEGRLDTFANALIGVENLIPASPGGSGAGPAPLPTLYFCIPHNDKMLGYWDMIADRLYKIRHCMNIEGVVRQLALFEPPIDPAALVKAVAGGLSVSAALSDLNAPLPLYRFPRLLDAANVVCGDVRALGAALLTALEKKDAEALSVLRQGQEIAVQQRVKEVRAKQVEEAGDTLEALKRSRDVVKERADYYRDVEKINGWEGASLIIHGLGIVSEIIATVLNATAGVAHLVPDIHVGASGFGGSPHVTVDYGGVNVGNSAFNWASFFGGLGGILHSGGNLTATVGTYERRWDEWKLQERVADKELVQIDQSIAAATVHVQIAQKELDNQAKQIEEAQALDAFMRSKYTNEELYQWQIGQISGVYFQSYRLAHDLAKRTERTFRFELGLQSSDYISFGYWDSLKKGLLSGERLQFDLRRLEAAYLDRNRREFEITRRVSLSQIDPLALTRLRETGRCFLNLPEELFDRDYPGHYFRRIKSVSLSVPCVAGPYTAISSSLRLLKNSIRINAADGDNGYPRNTDDQGAPADDDRFIENNIAVKAIAASGSQEDSGMFTLDFRDERYLPFEGAGVISSWSLELFSDLPANNPDPANPDFGRPLRQFDYETISDVILHVHYTAREDAGPFKNGAISHLRTYFQGVDAPASELMLDLRQELPTQWSRFLYPENPANGNVFVLPMSSDLFGFRDAGKTLNILSVRALARCANSADYKIVLAPPLSAPPATPATTLTARQELGGMHTGLIDLSAAGVSVPPTGDATEWSLRMRQGGGGNLVSDAAAGTAEVADILLIVSYVWS